MDNIVIKKILDDSELIELLIIASNDYVNVNQNCYVSKSSLIKLSILIEEYLLVCDKDIFYLSGELSGNYTPAFSMTIIQPDKFGHVLIEMNMEINDNSNRSHRCTMFVKSELGCLERFGNRIKHLIDSEIGFEITLN